MVSSELIVFCRYIGRIGRNGLSKGGTTFFVITVKSLDRPRKFYQHGFLYEFSIRCCGWLRLLKKSETALRAFDTKTLQ